MLNTTRWTPTSCKWGYKSYKWPSKWVTGVTTPTISGIRTPFIFGRGPTLYVILKVQQHRMIDDFFWSWNHPSVPFLMHLATNWNWKSSKKHKLSALKKWKNLDRFTPFLRSKTHAKISSGKWSMNGASEYNDSEKGDSKDLVFSLIVFCFALI